ncbi:MAG: hypothetical protein DME59_09640 [Verrucomicrobia bacterium]|nr:MAG: hypothetical protein DME59_09640 [Verrucomicrobiota bacterium]PYL76271.1 MAG: hypothetical protein DMF26_06495 [Verrucomicrobiota bacterium]
MIGAWYGFAELADQSNGKAAQPRCTPQPKRQIAQHSRPPFGCGGAPPLSRLIADPGKENRQQNCVNLRTLWINFGACESAK